MRKRFGAAIFIIIIILSFSGCKKEQTIQQTGYHFDTVVTITLYDTANTDILDGCFDLCEKYDYMFSRTYTSSELYQLNEAAKQGDITKEVSPELAEIIDLGLYYSAMSNGAFDITIGAVSELWDFKSETATPPSSSDIEDAVKHVGYSNISVDLQSNTVSLKQGTVIDLGGIAKGYIADKLKEYLISNGIQHAIIDLGGNVLTIGAKTDGSNFNIGVQKPFSDSGELYAIIGISDKAVVTSGNYERYFTYDGNLYHHILDTKTGYPVGNNINSVTIIANDSLTAEILSTTCFAMGTEKALEYIKNFDGAYALFILDDATCITSEGFEEYININYQ